MSSQTSLVAEQVRLQQWAAQIQDCKNRPADMKVETWCSEHGITEYSCAMKSHFRKSGNQVSGQWKSSHASLLA